MTVSIFPGDHHKLFCPGCQRIVRYDADDVIKVYTSTDPRWKGAAFVYLIDCPCSARNEIGRG